MPLSPELKILDLSSCCQAKLLFVERGQMVGKTVCSGCLQVQEEPVPSHPQETEGEECSGIRFSHNESGMVHIKCPPCHDKFLEAQRFAEAKGAEKERERILKAITTSTP